jgi:hypothetical protein
MLGVLILATNLSFSASGPQTAWNVFTLPNPVVTPSWRSYAPPGCLSNPDACAQNHRFWEEWDFTTFQDAIDNAFAAVSSVGKYQGVMLIMPLGDTAMYWNNIQLIYRLATRHGVQVQPVLFAKWKYGAEYCYLYNGSAPSACQTVPGTSTAVAYQKMLNLMNFVQTLSGSCATGSYNRRVSVWYGWNEFAPGYTVLKNFWQSLPTRFQTSKCNLQAAYVTWLDSGFAGNSDVRQLQNFAINKQKRKYWVDTELYSTAQIQQYGELYAPYQTIVTGYWGASDIVSWAAGICAQWNIALQPERLGVWTFYDRDISPLELYRAYINGEMAPVQTVCGP